MISISRIYQKRLPNFFSGERRLNWSHQLNIFEPTTRRLTSVNRCLVFQLFGFKISLYGASFQQNTAIVFRCNFLFCVFFVNFFWFIQSELVFQHPFATLRSDRGSLVYSCLRLHSASTWNLRTFLVARSFACYFQCINVGLGGSFAHCEILTMRFFGYAEGLACCLLLAWCNETLVGESKVDTFHAFRGHSFWTQTK